MGLSIAGFAQSVKDVIDSIGAQKAIVLLFDGRGELDPTVRQATLLKMSSRSSLPPSPRPSQPTLPSSVRFPYYLNLKPY